MNYWLALYEHMWQRLSNPAHYLSAIYGSYSNKSIVKKIRIKQRTGTAVNFEPKIRTVLVKAGH